MSTSVFRGDYPLKGTLGSSDLNLDQLLSAFKQTLPNGKGEGVGKLLNASA